MQERIREQQLTILGVTQDLLREAEELVGTPIEIEPAAALINDARAILSLPSGSLQHCAIVYLDRHRTHVDHLIAHELGHLRRLYSVPPEQRFVALGTGLTRGRRLRQLEPEIERIVVSGVPRALLTRAIPIWMRGLIAKLANTPADLRIERRIHDEHPELRALQRLSLLDQARDLQRGLSLEVARLMPAAMYANTLLLNYVIISEFGDLCDRPELELPYVHAVDRQLGNELRRIAIRGPDTGHLGDIEISQVWAEVLGMTEWFEWVTVKGTGLAERGKGDEWSERRNIDTAEPSSASFNG